MVLQHSRKTFPRLAIGQSKYPGQDSKTKPNRPEPVSNYDSAHASSMEHRHKVRIYPDKNFAKI